MKKMHLEAKLPTETNEPGKDFSFNPYITGTL